MLKITAIQAFKDNYIWVLRREGVNRVAVVDPGDAEPVLASLDATGLKLGGILVTHHHWDHTNGIAGLLRRSDVPVYGPAGEREPIQGMSGPLQDGDRLHLDFLAADFRAITIPGHTLGHIALHGHGLLFCGDTLFSAGCGRLFEGTAGQMHDSLAKLAALPAETQVFCGHEYTESNLAFALAVEPENAATRMHADRVGEIRRGGLPSLPSTLALERQINPFLRCDRPEVTRAVSAQAGRSLSPGVDTFAALRQWKDHFVPPRVH